MAVEDERFYEHHGVDFQGVARAMVENLRAGGIVQGGSTITEQYVKNAYVGDERTYTRKLREAVLAWQLEDRWSKDKILTEYLNTVYYGAGAYGVEAAARTYFHKHASAAQPQGGGAARGAAQVPLGSTRRPPTRSRPRSGATWCSSSWPTRATSRRQRADKPWQASSASTSTRRTSTTSMADYFVDYVTRQLTKRYGSRQVFEGGLKVVHEHRHEVAAGGHRRHQEHHRRRWTSASSPRRRLVAIDPENGYIRTMVGGLDYKKQKFNLAWQAKRQPGSAMKPFVLTAAVEQGMNPDTTYYNSQQPDRSSPWAPTPRRGSSTATARAARRASRPPRPISDNVVFAQLSVDVGPENTVDIGAQDGHHQPARRGAVDHARHLRRHPARDGRRLRHAGQRRHPPHAAGHRQGRAAATARSTGSPRPRASAPSPPASPAWSRSASSASPSGGTGVGDRLVLPVPARRQDRHHRERLGRLVLRLHAQLAAAVWMGDAEKNSPMDGAYGGTYCAPMWAQVLRRGAQGPDAPELRGRARGRSARGRARCRPCRRRRRRRRAAARRRARARPRPSSRQPHADHDHARAHAAPTPKPTPRRPSPRRRRRARPAQRPKQVVVSDLTPMASGASPRPTSVRRASAAAGPAWPARSWTGSPASSASDV